VFAPPSPFFKNVECVRETEIQLEQQPPQGVFVCEHAGLVINKFSLAAVKGSAGEFLEEALLELAAHPNQANPKLSSLELSDTHSI